MNFKKIADTSFKVFDGHPVIVNHVFYSKKQIQK